jgi:hypothetical protein
VNTPGRWSLTATANWFVAPRALYNNAQFPLFNGTEFVALYRNRVALGGLDVGNGFGKTEQLARDEDFDPYPVSPSIILNSEGFAPVLLETLSSGRRSRS